MKQSAVLMCLNYLVVVVVVVLGRSWAWWGCGQALPLSD